MIDTGWQTLNIYIQELLICTSFLLPGPAMNIAMWCHITQHCCYCGRHTSMSRWSPTTRGPTIFARYVWGVHTCQYHI